MAMAVILILFFALMLWQNRNGPPQPTPVAPNAQRNH